jgi:hypothetical protein
MSECLTGRHYVCPRCGCATQFIVRVPHWFCPSCQHELAADGAGPALVQSYADLIFRQQEQRAAEPKAV